MRGINALLSSIPFVSTFFDFPIEHPPLPSLDGFRLSSVISSDRAAFNLNQEASDRVSASLGASLRGFKQVVPRYKYATAGAHRFSAEAVLDEWGAQFHGLASAQARAARVSDPSMWSFDEVVVPDVADKQTVLTLAYIAANAYVPTPHEGDWTDVGGEDGSGWRHDDGYGWDDDGLRGYLFVSKDNDSLVLSVKGTSTALLGDGGPTVPNDKLNDNLLFSCCCARISYLWDTVCDCFLGDNRCDERCLERELYREDRYYRQALAVFEEAVALYPDAKNVWITGHSLGGALAAMIGRTYGLPVVTFEAPGEQIAVRRLHLPTPPGIPLWDDYVWHFGHNADPIFLGTCSGSGSSCSMKGYAMESVCHTGHVCMYDVKKDLGWHESVVNHRIHIVIDDVLVKYDEPASCVTIAQCGDCSDWEFVDPLAVDPPSSSAASSTSTTKSTAAPTTAATTAPTAAPTSTEAPTTKPPTTHTKPYATATESCIEYAWYGACKSYTTVTYTVTPDPPEPTTSCVERAWYGACNSYTTYYPFAAPRAYPGRV